MKNLKRNVAASIFTMKYLVTLILVALLAESVVGKDSGDRIEVAKGGESPYVIVIPDDVDPKRVEPAAKLLQATIAEAAGAKLPIVKESEKTGDGPAIYLGKTKMARERGLPLDKVKGWAFLIRTDGNDVFIVGDESDFPIVGSKQGYTGTLKAVTAFLEDQLGIRFLLPGPYGKRVPKLDPLTVDANMDLFVEPRFEYVIGRAPRRDKAFAAALNLFGRTPILKTYGGHSYYTSVPKADYGETNPEYFAMRGGVRDAGNNHLCVSNPDVKQLMLEEMEKQFANGYQWVELAQTDGYQACQCPECVKIHPDESERLWIVHRQLAEEMNRRHPDKKVMIISYGPTRHPPKSFKSFPDNVVIQVCDYRPEILEEWVPFNVDKSVYIYNWGGYKTPGLGPTRTPHFVIEQIRRFLDNGVRGIYICGGYDTYVGYGLNGPALYAFGKALSHPEIDPAQALDDYVNALFGEAAAPMRAFYHAMYDRLETYSLFDTPNVKTKGLPSSFKSPEYFYCHCFPPKLLKDMTLNLERAKAMAKDEKVKAALKMVEFEFDYVKLVASVFHVYRAYRVHPTRASFDLLAKKMKEWKDYLDSLYGEDGKCVHKLPGGLPLLFRNFPKAKAAMNGRIMGVQAPFNWDFDLLKERGVLPGAGKPKRLDAPKITPFTIDGDIDKTVWKDIPFQELSEIGMGKAKDATRFKVAYGDDALYVAVECDFHSDGWMKHLKETGRDGNAWAQECVEMCVDPWGEREKHYQLVFSPIENATFDSRRGTFGDPLDPFYGKTNVSWNGDWTYAFKIDEKNKRWTAEAKIPYSTLEVAPPHPGDLWTFNIGRAQWPKGYGKGSIYHTWAPNLEGRSFHDRSSFGELVFK